MIQKLAVVFTALIALSACSNDAVLSPTESTVSTVPPTACSVGEWEEWGL